MKHTAARRKVAILALTVGLGASAVSLVDSVVSPTSHGPPGVLVATVIAVGVAAFAAGVYLFLYFRYARDLLGKGGDGGRGMTRRDVGSFIASAAVGSGAGSATALLAYSHSQLIGSSVGMLAFGAGLALILTGRIGAQQSEL